MQTIKICTQYRLDQQLLTTVPVNIEQLSECEPVYEELPGWQSETTHIKTFADLPQNAQNYLKRIAELANVPIAIISTGPDREETIVMEPLFA